MKVNVVKKIAVSDITNGKRYQSDVEKYDNCTGISEVEITSEKYYQLTYTVGTGTYTVNKKISDYIIAIMP